MHIMLKPILWPVCSISSSHGCDCLTTIYTHGFDFWSPSRPARDILTHGCCSVKSLCDTLVPRQYSHIFRPLGFLDLDLLSCPCFIFSFFFLIRQLLLHQSSACQIACWCLEDLWTKQSKVPVLTEFVGSKSRFCTKYFFLKNVFCWNPTMPVNHVVSGNSSYKFKGKQLPWRPCGLLPAEPKATLYKNGLLACLLHLQITWAYNLPALFISTLKDLFLNGQIIASH